MSDPKDARSQPAAPHPLPHLSHSRISRYLHCPEQYRLYYVENLRPRVPAATLVFGQLVHQALAQLFAAGVDPAPWFAEAWAGVNGPGLSYGTRESWDKLDASGRALLQKFVAEDLPRIGKVRATEQPFELAISGLDLPFVGIIDLVADLDERRTLVDFKTSGSAYETHEAVLSDQLTAYHLAEPESEQSALCVLVKTKEPKIEWHVVTRSSAQLIEYLAKARLVAREIAAGHFYKRPGKWCTWCDYLPVCLGDKQKTAETLLRIG